jgi:hypothetical protein
MVRTWAMTRSALLAARPPPGSALGRPPGTGAWRRTAI